MAQRPVDSPETGSHKVRAGTCSTSSSPSTDWQPRRNKRNDTFNVITNMLDRFRDLPLATRGMGRGTCRRPFRCRLSYRRLLYLITEGTTMSMRWFSQPMPNSMAANAPPMSHTLYGPITA